MYKSKKAARAAVAAVLVAGLALAPAAAFAQTSALDVADAPVTITGVNKGDTVKFYQVFDADIDATNNLTYTTKVSGLPAGYDSAAKVAGKVSEQDARAVADAIAPVVTAGAPKYSASAGEDGRVTQSLDSGLYLVTVTTEGGKTKVYQTMLVNASPEVQNGQYAPASLSDRAAKSQDVPAPEKKVVSANGTDSGASTDTYSVGDTATFRIDATVPSFPSNATHAFFSVTDVPEAGLSVKQDSVKVYDGAELKTPVDASNYTVKPAGDSFTVEFEWDYLKTRGSQKVRVEYQAEVVSINKVTGMVGNKAFGTFTPNPYEDQKVSTTPTDPQIKTYGFAFKKVTPTGAALPGAEFTVTDARGNLVTYIDAKGDKVVSGKVVSDENGYVHVNGLEAGTYTVTETGVPAGYQKVDPFTITLDATDTGDSPATPGVTEKNFDVTTADVTDPKQGQLPTTGGAGTAALTAGGILLVAGGAVVVFRSRKQN